MPEHDAWGVIRENGQSWLALGSQKLIQASEMLIFGEHNIANALAALALGSAANIPQDAMLAVLREFPGLDHRCQLVTRSHGVAWYNDSKGTNVGATLAALDGLGPVIDGKIILVAGGQGKGQDFRPLSASLSRFGKSVILLGEDADRVAEALDAGIPRERVHSLEAAVARAAALAAPGDAVLLSPACASFDMFKGYDDRGRRFVAAVRSLTEAA